MTPIIRWINRQEDSSVLAEEVVLMGVDRGESSDQPLPTLSNSEEEVRKLIDRQQEDGSWSELRIKAENVEDIIVGERCINAC